MQRCRILNSHYLDHQKTRRTQSHHTQPPSSSTNLIWNQWNVQLPKNTLIGIIPSCTWSRKSSTFFFSLFKYGNLRHIKEPIKMTKANSFDLWLCLFLFQYPWTHVPNGCLQTGGPSMHFIFFVAKKLYYSMRVWNPIFLCEELYWSR